MYRFVILLFLHFFLITSVQADDASFEERVQNHSYALGATIGKQFADSNQKLDQAAFMQAIEDAFADAPPLLNQQQMREVVTGMQNAHRAQRENEANKALDEGRTFLENNKTKSGVISLASGLQYKVIKAGTGIQPKKGATVMVHYKGTLINGREFDNSYKRGQPMKFSLNSTFKGFQEALLLMKEGAIWQIFIPAELAYGKRGAGSMIGPNETLIFEIELVEID